MNRRGFLKALFQGTATALALAYCPKILAAPKVEEPPVLMGFRGTSKFEAGYVYAPYQPMVRSASIMGDFRWEQRRVDQLEVGDSFQLYGEDYRPHGPTMSVEALWHPANNLVWVVTPYHGAFEFDRCELVDVRIDAVKLVTREQELHDMFGEPSAPQYFEPSFVYGTKVVNPNMAARVDIAEPKDKAWAIVPEGTDVSKLKPVAKRGGFNLYTDDGRTLRKVKL